MKRLLVLLMIFATFSGCVATLPAQTSAQKVISHHLNRYVKKYPQSPIGTAKIEKVDVYSLNQEKRGYASATVFLTTSASDVYQAQFVLKRDPFGWRVSSWEILQSASQK